MPNEPAPRLTGSENAREEIIPDPIYGYMRRSMLEHEKTDGIIRNDLVERDLSRAVYVDRIGWNDWPTALICEKM